MTPQKPVSDADIEATVRAELPWLLERSRARAAAASEDTVSGRLRRAVAAMKQPCEQSARRRPGGARANEVPALGLDAGMYTRILPPIGTRRLYHGIRPIPRGVS